MAEMAMVRQKNNESIQDYGNRVKIVLKKLHEASSRMCPEAAGALRIANERNAINKFEQNLLDTTLRITVNATSKDTLKQSIIIAMEKEIWLKGSNVVSCTFAKSQGIPTANVARDRMQSNVTTATSLATSQQIAEAVHQTPIMVQQITVAMQATIETSMEQSQQ